MKDSNKYPVSRKDNIVVQEVDGELLIYDLAIDKAFCLNSTSRLVWQASDGNKSTAEIADFVSKKLNLPASEDLIWFALEQLKKENLIENGSLETSPFKGMKRREVIRKVGLSSLIALPLIMSLTTPIAVQSASSTCSAIACNCTIMFSSPMTTCSSIADCMTDTNPTCMCSNLTCIGSGPGNVTCSGVCGS